MRSFLRLTTVVAPLLLTICAFSGCSPDEGAGGKMNGGAMDKGKMDGAMDKGKMDGTMDKGKMDGAMDKGKMDGAMDKGKMDGTPK
jgi:hypothetical protein